MKHIALLLAILIFAFSAISCGDLTYYKGAGWSCTQEEFLDKYYDSVSAKILEIAERHDIRAVLEGTDVTDDHFILFLYDASFTARFDFMCEELWGKCTADLHFYGKDESELSDYNAQKKYIDFFNEFAALFAYDVELDTCKYEDAFNFSMEQGGKIYETQIHYDAMTRGAGYSVQFGVDENVGSHTLRNRSSDTFKCNCYRFYGLLDGDLANILAS